jgi:hypothetical protein
MMEALQLSEDILRNIELSEISLTNIALKTSRLARLLNDFDVQKIMELEAGGYPLPAKGYEPDIWRLCEISGRVYEMIDNKTNLINRYAYPDSISMLEETIKVSEAALESARDPSNSVSSANPGQFVPNPIVSNSMERSGIVYRTTEATTRLGTRRSYIYSYVQRKYYELKFSGIADDIFSRIRIGVDERIGTVLPESTKKFSAVYDNLQSENPEDWANAVHSCRRILQNLADKVFPPTDEKRKKLVNGKERIIDLGSNNYINRLIAYAEDNIDSTRYEELVGSQLAYLGDRLDSIFQVTQKGSHSTVEKEEADRYVVYTYLLVGDLLSLKSN